VVAALVQGNAVGVVAVHAVVGDQVAFAVTVDDHAGEFVVVALVVDDPAVVDLARDDDAVLLLGAEHGVLGDDQAVGAVVRVDAVDDVVAVGVALDHHVLRFVAVEAVPVVDELGVDQPAGRLVALKALVHVRRVLGNRYPVGLRVAVAQAGDHAAGDIQLATAPGHQEGAELLAVVAHGR